MEYKGYKYIEVPSLISKNIISKCLENTNNRAFEIDQQTVLLPEVTQYIKNQDITALGSNKIYYTARCFRNELNTGPNRFWEFTQIGVELLGENELDCCRDVRRDAIWLFKKLLGNNNWKLIDGAERGLNLYLTETNKQFEIKSLNNIQLLGGGPYEGGAGFALGLERLMNFQIKFF